MFKDQTIYLKINSVTYDFYYQGNIICSFVSAKSALKFYIKKVNEGYKVEGFKNAKN